MHFVGTLYMPELQAQDSSRIAHRRFSAYGIPLERGLYKLRSELLAPLRFKYARPSSSALACHGRQLW